MFVLKKGGRGGSKTFAQFCHIVYMQDLDNIVASMLLESLYHHLSVINTASVLLNDGDRKLFIVDDVITKNNTR